MLIQSSKIDLKDQTSLRFHQYTDFTYQLESVGLQAKLGAVEGRFPPSHDEEKINESWKFDYLCQVRKERAKDTDIFESWNDERISQVRFHIVYI